MKKLALMSSREDYNFETIAEYFKNKDVEIKIIYDCENEKILDLDKFDLIALVDYHKKLDERILSSIPCINLQPSLMPAFEGANAIERAYRHGVKVSGVTVFSLDRNSEYKKIIAQYPVLINETMNLMDLEKEILTVAHKLYPPVIDSVLNDRVFSFDMLFGNQGGECGGCGGCGH